MTKFLVYFSYALQTLYTSSCNAGARWMLTNVEYDFKGNLLQAPRFLPILFGSSDERHGSLTDRTRDSEGTNSTSL